MLVLSNVSIVISCPIGFKRHTKCWSAQILRSQLPERIFVLLDIYLGSGGSNVFLGIHRVILRLLASNIPMASQSK